MTDDLDRRLAPRGGPSPELRERLGDATLRVVRRRRRVRRLGTLALMAACVVGGALAMWAARPAPEVRVETVVKEVPVPTPAPADESVAYESPRSLELAAEQADGAAGARLFLEAGRRYGRDWNDWPSALRCYRNALDLGDGPAAAHPDDDWLLAKLKTERRETHANP